MRRAGIVWMVGVLLAAGGCTASATEDPGGPEPQPLAALDGFAAAGLRASRTVPKGGRGLYFDTRDDAIRIVAAGTSLVALALDGDGEVSSLVSSADLGRTWKHVDLPGVTASIVRLWLSEVGPLVVATGGTDDDSAWVTGDGATWRGGPVPTRPDGGLLDEPARHPDGRVVVGTQGDRLVLTADGGATWETAECPALFRAAKKCDVARSAGGNLWTRGSDVSPDAGQTWRPATVVPGAGPSTLKDVVPRPGGGWIGTAVTMPGPTTLAERLVVSDDGLTWAVRPSPCDAAQGSTVSRPRALGGRWLVAYTCLDPQDAPLRSVLSLVDAAGSGATALGTVDRPGSWFGAPVAVGTTVVVPEIHGGGPGTGTLALLHLTV